MKRFLPKSLAGQLIALLLVGLLLSQGLALLLFTDERRGAIRTAHQFGLIERTASIVRLLEETQPAFREKVLAAANSRRLRVWLSEESTLPASERSRRVRWLQSAFEEMLARDLREPLRLRFVDGWRRDRPRPSGEGHGHGWDRHRKGLGLALSVPLGGGGWLNVVTKLPPRPIGWAWPTLLSMLLMAVVILTAVALTLRRITRPLTALSDAAERLGRGESVAPLPESGPREIRQTTTAFNEMRTRLTRFVRDRTLLLAAISHDLRTPITSLRLRAELVEDEETRAKLLETLEEMQRLVETTLAFAREEADQEETRLVDLAALVESLCDDLADLGQEVHFSGGGKAPHACRPVSLKRALRNLIENAVAYGQRARVALKSVPEAFIITVEDDGPGIPEEAFERVFAPFVRLEESRSRQTGGIGLGLAIARSIVRSHGGDILLANRPEGGLRVTITLPRNRGAKASAAVPLEA